MPAETPSPFEQTLNISTWGQLPQIVVDSRYGFTIGNPSRFGAGSYPDEHLYQARQEQLSWVHGAFLLKAGFEFSHNTDATSLLRNQTGTYYYSSVENFASDALAFADVRLEWPVEPDGSAQLRSDRQSLARLGGKIHGLGYLPCYSYYSQTMGPADWWRRHQRLGQLRHLAMAATEAARALGWRCAGNSSSCRPQSLRLTNPDLPLTQSLPSLGNQWGPRASVAWGANESHWPVLRVGYGMYFGRTQNARLKPRSRRPVR